MLSSARRPLRYVRIWLVSVLADVVGEYRLCCNVVHMPLWKAAFSALTLLAQGLNHVKFDDRTVETDFESLENMVCHLCTMFFVISFFGLCYGLGSLGISAADSCALGRARLTASAWGGFVLTGEAQGAVSRAACPGTIIYFLQVIAGLRLGEIGR